MAAFIVGDKVLRKSDQRRRLCIGVIESIRYDRIRVRWPAPRRIGGEFHHSTVKAVSLLPATDERVQQWRAEIAAIRTAEQARQLARFTWECVDHNGTGRPLPLQPSQACGGRCYMCGGVAIEKGDDQPA